MTITAEIIGAQRVVSFFETLPEKTVQTVRQEVTALAIELRDRVVATKLQGQVLNVKTGNLQRSVNYEVTEDGGNIQGAVGTNIIYARIHELGGTIQAKARQATLRFRVGADGGLMKQDARFIGPMKMRNAAKMLVFAKASHKRVATRNVKIGAHEIKIPARPFLRPSLAEMAPQIRERLQKAVGLVNKGTP